jgi:hypothetical protein
MFGMTRVSLNSLPLRGNDKTVSGSDQRMAKDIFDMLRKNKGEVFLYLIREIAQIGLILFRNDHRFNSAPFGGQ